MEIFARMIAVLILLVLSHCAHAHEAENIEYHGDMEQLYNEIRSRSLSDDVLYVITRSNSDDDGSSSNNEIQTLISSVSDAVKIAKVKVDSNNIVDDEDTMEHDHYHHHHEDYNEDHHPDPDFAASDDEPEEESESDEGEHENADEDHEEQQAEQEQQDTVPNVLKERSPDLFESLQGSENGIRFVYISKSPDGIGLGKVTVVPEQDARSDARLAEWIKVIQSRSTKDENERDPVKDGFAKSFANARKAGDFTTMASSMQSMFRLCALDQSDEKDIEETSPCFRGIRGYATIMKQLTSFDIDDIDTHIQDQIRMLSRLVQDDVTISTARKEAFRDRLHAVKGFVTSE